MGNSSSSSRKEPSPAKVPFRRTILNPQPPVIPPRLNVVPTYTYSKIPEPPKPVSYARTIEPPQSYKLWTESYYNTRLKPEDLDRFSTRISAQSDELQRKANEQKAHDARMNRINILGRIGIEKKPAIKYQPTSILSYMPIKDRLIAYKKNDKKYFSLPDKRPELTPEILKIVQNASSSHSPNAPVVEIDGVQILRKDIQTLVGLNWLNDEIINAYMNLIVTRSQQSGYKKAYAFNTFFYPRLRDSGYASVKRWTRRIDLFSHDFVIVPVHLGNHWCLAFIDFTHRIISYYDSLGGHPGGCCDKLLDYLREESKDKKKQDFDDENWRLINRYSEGIPQQKNCSDCGVFACIYAEFLARQAKLNFGQEDMPYYRKKMIYEIISKRIME